MNPRVGDNTMREIGKNSSSCSHKRDSCRAAGFDLNLALQIRQPVHLAWNAVTVIERGKTDEAGDGGGIGDLALDARVVMKHPRDRRPGRAFRQQTNWVCFGNSMIFLPKACRA